MRIDSTDYTVTNPDGSKTNADVYGTFGALVGLEFPLNREGGVAASSPKCEEGFSALGAFPD